MPCTARIHPRIVRYPLGVIILPPVSMVVELPINTVVNISARISLSFPRERTPISSPSRPIFLT